MSILKRKTQKRPTISDEKWCFLIIPSVWFFRCLIVSRDCFESANQFGTKTQFCDVAQAPNQETLCYRSVRRPVYQDTKLTELWRQRQVFWTAYESYSYFVWKRCRYLVTASKTTNYSWFDTNPDSTVGNISNSLSDNEWAPAPRILRRHQSGVYFYLIFSSW